MSPCPLRGCLDLLLMRCRVFAALATLQKLHKTEGQGSHDQVRHDISDELHQISDQQTLDAQDRTANMFQLVRDKRYRKRMLMGFLMQCMTQSTGILVINNYMVCRPWKHWFALTMNHVVSLNSIGHSTCHPRYRRVDATSPQCHLEHLVRSLERGERLHRRSLWTHQDHCHGNCKPMPTPLLALAQRLANLSWMLQSGGVLSMCVVAALSAHYGNPENTNRAGSIAAVVWIFIFVTFYGSCVDATSFIYTSEIFPTKIRAQGVGFSLSGFFLTDAGESDCSTSRNAGHGRPHGLR